MDAAALSASTRAVKERVRTYQPHILQQLLDDSKADGLGDTATFGRATSAPHMFGGTGTSNSLYERGVAQRAAKEAEMREKQEAYARALERKKHEATLRKDAQFQASYNEVLEGLSSEQGIMGETQYTLEHKAKIKRNKSQQLYGEWQEQVFDKIQDRLQRAVSQRSHRSIEKRLQGQMNDYLQTTNTKIGVFRDVIIESDYNPLTALDNTIKIPTGDIRDPVKRDMLKPQYERALMGLSSELDSQPVGKSTLDNKRWGSLQIRATPYGHCMDNTGNYIVRPLSGSAIAARKSRVAMDHYDYPTTNAAAAEEMGRIHKGMPPGPEVIRGRTNLFGVLQQTSGDSVGDLWLEAKGKAKPPGPEQMRGRKDLREVIQQSSNPYQDGRSLGDQWLEAKGKAKPPSPEEMRGRKDLREVIQQSSNPYHDGRTLGDQWLEAKGKRPIQGTPPTMQTVINTYQAPPDPPPAKDGRRAHSHLVNDRTLTVRQ